MLSKLATLPTKRPEAVANTMELASLQLPTATADAQTILRLC